MAHPKFQTVEWWIEQLKEYNPKAVVHIATRSGDSGSAMLSTYYARKKGKDRYPHDLGEDDIKKLWIDVG